MTVGLHADLFGLFICDPYKMNGFRIFKIRPRTAEIIIPNNNSHLVTTYTYLVTANSHLVITNSHWVMNNNYNRNKKSIEDECLWNFKDLISETLNPWIKYSVTKWLICDQTTVGPRADLLGPFICDPYEMNGFGIFKIRPQMAEIIIPHTNSRLVTTYSHVVTTNSHLVMTNSHWVMTNNYNWNKKSVEDENLFNFKDLTSETLNP